MSALLEARDLSVSFPVGGGWLQPARQVPAVRGVNLALQAGEALAVVGESGSGKTTLARALLGLVPVSGGQVIFAGQDTATMPASARQAMRRQVQMVFQDPFGSLDPRLTVGGIIAEPLEIHGLGTTATRRARIGLAYLMISHDLAAVHHLADRVATMYLGAVVEVAGVEEMFTRPAHPYTAGLLAAVPRLGAGKRVPGGTLPGDIPSPLAPPPGCVFHPRCAGATARCGQEVPLLRPLDAGRAVACHHPLTGAV